MQTSFQIERQTVTFNAMRIRPELQDENPLPDIDLFFTARMGNDSLALLAPDMRSLLYKKGDQQTTDGSEAGLTVLRFPELGRQRIKKEIVGAEVTVHYGVGESNGKSTDIVIAEAIVDRFFVDPMEGGTIILGWRVRGKPTGEENGRLSLILGRETTLTVVPPEEKQGSLGLDQ
ncbi:hypothetical protein C4E15_28110 [Achromobacter spanius]|uniref:Uncharacterized protein n=1 Tax=Achromobacter spanius TaxID=217203 RepID=A0A2S5GIT8_9BURK|nr:hypothetical protein [Achromobacter spanius]PPA72831.1 hypothetical protein C4E15_28110 [Achromobacter spanius]